MQNPHTDYSFSSKRAFDVDLQELGWNMDIPLSRDGFCLYLWNRFEKGRKTTDKTLVPYKVLELEFGKILLRRGDVVHGGCLPGFNVKGDTQVSR